MLKKYSFHALYKRQQNSLNLCGDNSLQVKTSCFYLFNSSLRIGYELVQTSKAFLWIYETQMKLCGTILSDRDNSF